jgi:hypothetical protein
VLVNHQYEHVKDGRTPCSAGELSTGHTGIVVQGEVWDLNIQTLRDFWDLDLNVHAWYPSEIRHSYLRAISRVPVDHAFFIAPDDSGTLAALRHYFQLMPPQFSPFNIPAENQLALYYAPSDLQALPGEH